MDAKVQKMSDAELFAQCRKFGEIALKYKWKFAGLLPEVFRRKLYKKKGFGSIFEFAAKLAGMSEEQVLRVLNLEKKFEDKPELRDMLVNGEASLNKLAKIASIATRENQEALAIQVRLLPCRALETLARDEKTLSNSVHVNMHLTQNLEDATGGAEETLHENLGLSQEVLNKLSELKRRGIDINQLLLEFLEKRELEIAQEKEELSKDCGPTDSRYIPVAIRKVLTKEYGEKCSIQTCEKPSEEIHHTQRFSMAQTHNPKFLAPLCKEHHQIAHTADWRFHNARLRAAG